MTPEAAGYIEKARDLLAQAHVMLRVGLNDAVGRTAISRNSMRHNIGFSNGLEDP